VNYELYILTNGRLPYFLFIQGIDQITKADKKIRNI